LAVGSEKNVAAQYDNVQATVSGRKSVARRNQPVDGRHDPSRLAEWLPTEDWQAVVTGPWFWISLGLPPSMFAIILLAIRRITLRNTRPFSNLFRRRPKGRS
jgi:hypothetical protein